MRRPDHLFDRKRRIARLPLGRAAFRNNCSRNWSLGLSYAANQLQTRMTLASLSTHHRMAAD
ncbi:MAG: hypothetical protein WCE63_04340 [Acidobacteriaceae bacterium]